uniref:Putative portal protein n=1 Tax=viral metagenome TaxID=1070528 RepID=A0A6M3IGU8_9ZZZZ
MPMQSEWSLSNIPPKDHPDVASFANSLFDVARAELDRLGKHDDLLSNYSLYRRKSGGVTGKTQGLILVNLYFANIERTVANITARQPVGEVIDLDGTSEDGAEGILSAKLQKWWKETNQQIKIRASARQMEIYGVTFEKPTWNKETGEPIISLTDPFWTYPAPGFFENLDTDMPFVTFAYLKYIDDMEDKFGVSSIAADEAYDLLGTVREEYKNTAGYGSINTSYTGQYATAVTPAGVSSRGNTDKKLERCLVKEVWIRDYSTKKVQENRQSIDPQTGMPQFNELGEPIIETVSKQVQIYPDGVRKITITASKSTENKSGFVVLDDCANPNINPALPIEIASNTHPWGRFPIYHANSYKDLVSIWGFAAAEQVGDLIVNINKIISKLVNYVIQVMAPPLIVQKHCGISREMITNELTKAGRLILMPTTPNARIEFLQIPNLPATFFQVLDMLVRFFDRIYAIESADRGEAPRGVIAASAIVALQERNQELTQAKTSAIECLVENRSRWCIGLYQNFGTTSELVDVSGSPAEFIGVRFAGRKFGYLVESGSTTPKTSLQVQEQAVDLYKLGAVDRQALLENLNFPGWRDIVERIGEGQLNQALQVLIAAGLPEEQAVQLRQYLMEPRQGPGGKTAQGGTVKPIAPKAQQGA